TRGLAYSRLPTTEGDLDVEIQMPEQPQQRMDTWKIAAPCLFLLCFLVVYMDVLNFDMFPNPFTHFRRSEFREESFELELNATTLKEFFEATTMEVAQTTTWRTTIEASVLTSVINEAAFFRPRPEVAHVDCARLLRNDKQYMKKIAKKRPRLLEHVKLDMSCEAIKKRILPPRNPDTGFPIMYTRIVHTDYEFLEDQLTTNYADENVFCYSIDKKASRIFHERMFNLEKCLPNVIVPRKEEDVDGSGHNQNEAHLDCMRAVRGRKWEYAMLLQNHDVMIKSHGEMTEILKIYGGANDVEISHCPDGRCISSLEKNLGKLELCPKSLEGAESAKCNSSTIQWGKGAMQAILSRAAIDFLFDQVNIYPLMREMNAMGFGVDEQLYESLQITSEIPLPGGFHHKCRERPAQYISRISVWTGSENDCRSGRLRHSICIYGVEDLPFLAESKFVMANKMMPDFDQAVTSCVSELLFNRTRDGSKIDRKYYENINTVRYHHERKKPGFSINKFKCDLTSRSRH
ncbi:hypothetical protein PENTCL1PPCAC_5504, partial [Pristionchus entomophagus]